MGTRERHNEGLATRGRCEVPLCLKLDVAKVLLGVDCCRTHCEQMLSDCLNLLRDVMLYVMYVAVAIFMSRAIETRLAEARLEDRVVEAFGSDVRAVYLLTF